MPDQLEVAKRFGIGGYPLLIVFRHGKRYNYTGAREEEGEWVKVVTTIQSQFYDFCGFTCTQRIVYLYCTIYADSAGSPWFYRGIYIIVCLWQDLLTISMSSITSIYLLTDSFLILSKFSPRHCKLHEASGWS